MADTELLEERCINDLLTKVQTLPEFKNSCVPVVDDEDLFAQLANAPRPWCGVAYEGLVAVQVGISPSHKTGISTQMQFSLIYSVDAVLPGQTRGLIATVRQLTKARKQILATTGPTGHFWNFIAEIPIGNRNSKTQGTSTVWLQRWSIPLQQAPTQGTDGLSRFGAPST